MQSTAKGSRELLNNIKKARNKDQVLDRQAGMQAWSLSELKDPPPQSSHLQVEGGGGGQYSSMWVYSLVRPADTLH